MAAPDPTSEGGFLATVRAALRPAFRPRWWEFAVSFGLAALAAPFVTRLFWLERGAAFATVSGHAVKFGLPAAIVTLAVLWKLPDARAKAAARVLLQLAIVVTMLVPLNIAGGMASTASYRQTVRNAEVVLQEIHSFRATRGRLPESLDELRRAADRALPEPTYGGRFDLEKVEGLEKVDGLEKVESGFVLTLRVPGRPEVILFDSRKAEAPAGGPESDGTVE